MRIVLFCHSLVSDWNHGNAHFLRGVVAELQERGHEVLVFEPRDGWSRQNLVEAYGSQAEEEFHAAFPNLHSTEYDLESLDLDAALDGADLVLVHEWNEPDLVERIGTHHARNDYLLLFHDTHHRSVTAPEEMSRYVLDRYDGVLAFGASVAREYEKRGWGRRVWVWHEAADTRIFRPLRSDAPQGDVVWIGNWGDEERSAELHEFLLDPVYDLRLRARVYGVRYPQQAVAALLQAGIEYCGWAPNHRVPSIFSAYQFTVHVPRRPYAQALAGVPTIRVFEALACGIPLISAPWQDSEGLFSPGEDFLFVRSGRKMREAMRDLLNDPAYARELAGHGRETILRRHTCSHRVDELMQICAEAGLHESAVAVRS